MIVYNDIKRQFVNDVTDNSIADKILDAIKLKGLNAGNEKEYSQMLMKFYSVTKNPLQSTFLI